VKKPVSRDNIKPRFNVVCLFADISNVDVLEEYPIGQAKVFVTKDGRYLIIEPKITAQGHEIYEHMMEQLFLSLEPLEHARDPVSYIETHIWKEAEQQAMLEQVKSNFTELRYYLIRDIVGYGILDVMMNDDNIEEITSERFDRTVGVIHRKFTEFNILNSNVLFGSEDIMNSYIQRLVQRTGHAVTAAAPVMNAMTPTGDRVTVTYEREVSLPGPTIDIRKFTRQPYTITHLLELGAMSKLMAAYLWVLFDAKAFGLIIGETGSGKTTTINSLMCLTNPRWKIVTIEETPELKIPHYRWERLFTRTSPMISDSANYDITIMDLIKASLRMRPDFEIVGEVRGEEAFALFQSAATGHGGITSFHASGVESALSRLAAEPINIKASQQMLLWFVLHITRMRNEKKQTVRRVASLSEVIPRREGRVELCEIFRYDIKKNSFGTETPDELIKKSQRLQQAAYLLNIDNLLGDLKTRLYLIEQCLKTKAKKIDDVFAILGKYYSWAK